MSQSDIIFGALFFAFIVFITSRGELPQYMETLLGKSNPQGTSPASNANVKNSTTAANPNGAAAPSSYSGATIPSNTMSTYTTSENTAGFSSMADNADFAV